MNWRPTPDEVREVERSHFRQTGRRGVSQARVALSTVTDRKDPWRVTNTCVECPQPL